MNSKEDIRATLSNIVPVHRLTYLERLAQKTVAPSREPYIPRSYPQASTNPHLWTLASEVFLSAIPAGVVFCDPERGTREEQSPDGQRELTRSQPVVFYPTSGYEVDTGVQPPQPHQLPNHQPHMNYTVTEVSQTVKEWQSQGGMMLTYKLKGTFDTDPTIQVASINTKKDTPKVPRVGETIVCEITKDDPTFGKSIKRVMAMNSGTPSASAQSAPRASFESPDRQLSIERQNSLTNAVQHAVALSQMLLSTDLADDAMKVIDPTEIIAVARLFHAYTSGELDKPEVVAPTNAPTLLEDIPF